MVLSQRDVDILCKHCDSTLVVDQHLALNVRTHSQPIGQLAHVTHLQASCGLLQINNVKLITLWSITK